jgi:serine/threonine protein kinase
VYRVGALADGTPFFVMQYVPGESLDARLAREGPLPVDEVRRVMAQVGSALAAAHAKGIIHRDIKPANVLHDPESNRVLVSDFGIAALRSPDTSEASLHLTGTGMAIGTPQYMSPEQLLAEPVSPKTDVYSLGLLGYELLTGHGPFQVTTPHELIAGGPARHSEAAIVATRGHGSRARGADHRLPRARSRRAPHGRRKSSSGSASISRQS